MAISLSQINSFNQRISDASFNPNQIKQAKEELATYQKKSCDPIVQKAIDRARTTLLIKEQQAITAEKVNILYQKYNQFQQLFISKPKLTINDYNSLTKHLEDLRLVAESLLEDDFQPILPKKKYLESITQFKQELQTLRPSAGKTDLIVKAIIVTSITALFGYKLGWAAAGCSLIGSGTATLLFR
jgi:hypothetical protein